jgi:methyltransferase
MSSDVLFTALVLAVGLERLLELRVSSAHGRWARSVGAREYGRGHYPPMVALHTGLLVGAAAEVWLLGRAFVPLLGWPMVVVVVAAQGLRWWCIASLGRRWTTRVLVVPGMPLVRRGPYRWWRHPNYVAVAAEGVALPLVHGAWLTAAVFTAANASLLRVRVRCENAALTAAGSPTPARSDPANRPG